MSGTKTACARPTRLIKQTLTNSNGQVVKEQSYQHDNNGNIVKGQIQGIVQMPMLTAGYQYDGLDRLTQENYDILPVRNATYTFDANGNRLTKLQGQDPDKISELYRYAPNSNRIIDKDVLRQDDPPPDPVKDIAYDAKQRINKLFVDGKLKAEYRYDTRNIRTKKTLYDTDSNVTDTIYYHYDQDGLLIGESDGTGQAKREYVYLGGMPVAQIDIDAQGQESIVYVHTDHLATPRFATDQNQTVVWRWESDAYGSIPPQGSVTVNLRFPGQYYDQESGLFYNWNRYYDKDTGRYLTSDPIGLDGGLNSFLYAAPNPIRYIDPEGLIPLIHISPVRQYLDCARLRLLVWLSCKGKFSFNKRCSGLDDCPTLYAKWDLAQSCMYFQSLLSQRCYPGSSPNDHQQVINDAYNRSKRCYNLIQRNCLQCPVPQ